MGKNSQFDGWVHHAYTSAGIGRPKYPDDYIKNTPPIDRFRKQFTQDYFKTKHSNQVVKQLINGQKGSSEKLHEIKAY